MSYPSDLSEAQWALAGGLFARSDPRGQRERHPKRRVVEANRADGPEAGAVMARAKESYPSVESFTADVGYQSPSRGRRPRLGLWAARRKKTRKPRPSRKPSSG